MKYADLVTRIGGASVDAWAVHYEGLARLAEGDDIIVLSVGQETGEVTPEPIVDAGIASLRAGRHHYTPVHGESALREQLAVRHERLTGQQVEADAVSVFAGAQNALYAVSQCLLQPGDEVILLEPYYTTYPATFCASGATLVPVACRAENAFVPTVADVERAITSRTRALVVNSPNNPTGAIYPRDCIEALVGVCRERGLWLISDEVYRELADPGTCASPASVAGSDEVVVTICSLSKSHRMTGWRVGWTVSPPALAAHLYNLAMCMCYGQPMFTQDAAVVALQDEDGTAAQVRDLLKSRMQVMRDALSQVPGVVLHSAGAGMFVVADIHALGVDGREFAQGLLDQHDVVVLPCDGFGRSGAGLLRISLCEPEERLRDACSRFAAYVTNRGWQRKHNEPRKAGARRRPFSASDDDGNSRR